MGELDEDTDTTVRVLFDEVPVLQIEIDDTVQVMDIPLRASTSTDWPPAPPPPRALARHEEEELMALGDDLDLAMGTGTDARPVRNARIYAVVRRPTTSNEST